MSSEPFNAPSCESGISSDISIEPGSGMLDLGQWYWVTSERWNGSAYETYEWLGCVMRLGSNYVELEPPRWKHGASRQRVHFDEAHEFLRFEPEAARVIESKIAHYRQESARLLDEVKALNMRLGLRAAGALPSAQDVATQGTQMVSLSAQPDMDGYRTALIEAKEKTLPELFKGIEKANEEMARWMSAETLPMLAITQTMDGTISEIKDRIFNVSLYAGLTEQAVRCCAGAPAAMDEKLHVMQRRLYMDEESLLDYRAGGLEFDGIEAFDAWISQPHNRDRILPFARTLVAMRVRRRIKDRDSNGNMLRAFININLAESDSFTFLYVRNGDQVWRLSCEMDFGEMIFPDRTMFDPSEPKMVKMFASRVDKMISRSEYEERLAEYEARQARIEKWKLAHPGEPVSACPDSREIFNAGFRPSEWQPFDPSNVYFDECTQEIANRVKEYNRVALIIQGLFDRSEVLHPHPPVQSWTADGFARAITLIYDGAAVLHHGEAPDFEAYRQCCNASIKAGSITVGQELFWLEKEAERENRRLDADWRNTSDYRHSTFRPHGNPGPGLVARIDKWRSRAKEAVFTWERERQTNRWRNSDTIRCTISVPAERLLNIDAYRPGDFKQFFQDGRTRAEYLKWAPLLLTAEDYLAGKTKGEGEPS